MNWLGESTAMAPWESLLRLVMAAVFGAVLGFDRELRDKPAGLRTHMLISLAAAIFTLISLELYHEVVSRQPDASADPIRIIEAVTAGVAFLAAGAIIQSREGVRGITTGANMWLAGAIGVACGAGYYSLALFGTVLAVLVLTAMGMIEARMNARRGKFRESD